MKKQVFLTAFGFWADVVNENSEWYAALDVDGVRTIVRKDGLEIIRIVK